MGCNCGKSGERPRPTASDRPPVPKGVEPAAPPADVTNG
jgi:hypothetical protein